MVLSTLSAFLFSASYRRDSRCREHDCHPLTRFAFVCAPLSGACVWLFPIVFISPPGLVASMLITRAPRTTTRTQKPSRACLAAIPAEDLYSSLGLSAHLGSRTRKITRARELLYPRSRLLGDGRAHRVVLEAARASINSHQHTPPFHREGHKKFISGSAPRVGSARN